MKEALHNIVRHAQASEVHFHLEQENGALRLILSDDGCGLSHEDARLPEHGLGNMENRVTKLGGQFQATRGPDGGTRVTVVLPLGRSHSFPPS